MRSPADVLLSPSVVKMLLVFVTVLFAVFVGQMLFRFVRPWIARWLVRRKAVGKFTLFSLPSPPSAVSNRRALERRNAVERLAIQSENRLSRFLVSYEFLEAPPQFPDLSARQFTLESPEAIGQAVRLEWQLGSDEFLLADRVVDAVVRLRRTSRPTFAEGSFVFDTDVEGYPSIKLLHETDQLAAGRFPWSVLIETRFPQWYFERLSPIADWLGIGVRFAPASRAVLQGKCQIGSGMEGVVGGSLRGTSGEFGMTCAHVLSPECGSVVCTYSPTDLGNHPDAALINASSPCFGTRNPSRQCIAATEAEVRDTRIRKQLVIKGRSSRKKGYITCPVFELESEGGTTFRFPHLQIVPLTIPILGRFSAIFERAFSYEGDSGTWVFNEETGRWLGMIVAGDPDQRLSYAVEATPLLEYFRIRLGGVDLSPFD
jgi:hypothetical protein